MVDESETEPQTAAPAKKVAKPRATAGKRSAKRRVKKAVTKRVTPAPASAPAKYPRHTVERVMRLPRAILDQNAGHPATPKELAGFLGGTVSGALNLEISSAKKYGLLESQGGKLAITDRAKRALRPTAEGDELQATRDAILNAPDIAAVYQHYRGEYVPDETFLRNALTDQFGIPADKVSEFKELFTESMRAAKLLDESGDRARIIDIGKLERGAAGTKATGHGSGAGVTQSAAIADANATCFVMQPFADPWGGYYESIFKPAIEQSGLRPVRADTDIFGSGKIMDQVWRGISAASVLVAELTSRNPNVFYELGLAHALGKPVVLVSSNEPDVPFDLHHIRVIYYDVNDPFWGKKLIDKIADNVASAIRHPEEAIFKLEEVAP